jgi:hypothetical protein
MYLIRHKVEEIINQWVELETRLTVEENFVVNMINDIKYFLNELQIFNKVFNYDVEYIKSIEYEWIIYVRFQLQNTPEYIQIETIIK